MKLQWRLVLLTVLSFATCLVLVGYRTQSVLTKDKESSAAEYLSRQTATLSFSVTQLFHNSLETLVQFARQPSANSIHWGEFQMISMLSMASHGQWEPVWVEQRASTPSASWPAGVVQNMIRSVPFAKVKKGKPHWVRAAHPNGEPVFMMVTLVPAARTSARFGEARGEAILVGAYQGNPLVRLLNEFKGSKNRFFFVDDRGFIASDTRSGQMGQALSEDEFSNEILRGRSVQGGGIYKDAEAVELFTSFRRISDSNLTVAASIPVHQLMGVSQTFRSTLSAVGAGAIILLMTLAFLWGRSYSDRIQTLRLFVKDLTQQNFEKRLVSKSKDEVGLLANDLAHLQAQLVSAPERSEHPTSPLATPGKGRDWSLGLHSLLKEPLLSLIGHIQLIRPLVRGEEGREHIQSMERDTRAIKGLVDRLAPREEKDPTTEVTLAPLIENALGALKNEIQSRGLQVQLDLQDHMKVRGHSTELESALHKFLEWTLCASHSAAITRVEVSLREEAGCPLIELAVSGMELPFRSSREFQLWAINEADASSDLLDLAAARHLFEENGGLVQIAAEAGVTRLSVKWSESATQSPEQKLEQAAWVDPKESSSPSLELKTSPVPPELAVQLPELPKEEVSDDDTEMDEGIQILSVEAVDSGEDSSEDSKKDSWVAANLATGFEKIQEPTGPGSTSGAMMEPDEWAAKSVPASTPLRRPKLKV